MWDSSMFLSTLTPKFYVALTGTSSLISGLILIFEWWYFRKYGTSFIEQVSLNHISPWLSGEPAASAANNALPGGTADAITNGTLNGGHTNGTGGVGLHGTAGTNGSSAIGGANQPGLSNSSFNQTHSQIPECKMWRNPMALFRGAEYQRFYWAAQKEPLTFNDMNISAQDHQTFFTCEGDAGRPEYEIMQTAWRERNPVIRIKAAHSALEINPECAPAYILLAEEEATTIAEAEQILLDALVVAESNYKSHFLHQSSMAEGAHKRDTNVLIYIKRRLAMCARKLNNNAKAAKIFRDLTKEISPIIGLLNVHENLMEAMLEDGNYSDCAAVLAKFDDISLPKSATICYTAALLKARCVADKFSAEKASRHGLSGAEMVVVEAIHRAVEFNPHVPKYLLEMKALIFPPEHILKRGDSEALAYAFAHLRHWKRVDGALNMLFCTWEGTFRMLPYPLERGHLFYPYPACTECADRELLPAFHEVSVYPRKELPFFILFTAGLCTFTAMLAMMTHQYPEPMAVVAQAVMNFLTLPYVVLKERLEYAWPCNLLQQLSRI